MEEKLLEIMEKNEKNLNKNKEELQKVIEEETNKHKMELKDGKFSKTIEQNECEQDLIKINKELDNIGKDREILEKKQQKEKEIDEEKKKVKRLTINKRECEKAIKEEQGKYSFAEGKFSKTSELLEYEKDLEKINMELDSKLKEIVKQEKELETLNSYVDKMMSRYNVKPEMQEDKKEEKEAETENKEKKNNIKENKENKEEKVENKAETAEKNEENQVKFEVGPYLGEEKFTTEKNTLKEQAKKVDINDNAHKFEVGPYLGKDNINKSKTSDISDSRMNTNSQDKKPRNNDIDLSNINFIKKKIPQVRYDKKENIVKYIEIQEKDGEIKYYIEGDKKEYNISTEGIFEQKKENFKRLGISDMCREIAGGKIKGALLKRKINPEIVAVLENDTKQLKEYISSISEKKDLPFELVHNLENTSIFSKLKLNKFVRAEEKAGAWVCGKLFDKNRAIVAKEKTKAIAGSVKETAKDKVAQVKDFSQEKFKTVKSKGRDFVQKIPNKNSQIEAKAVKNLKERQKELAANVQKIMSEEKEK